MNSNPYQETTINSDYREAIGELPSNKIDWGKIALAYVLSFFGQMALGAMMGFVFGIMAVTMAGNIRGLIESPLFIIGVFALFLIPVVLSVVWLVIKFLHAGILAMVCFAIDLAITLPFSGISSWQELAFLPGKAVVILVAAALTILLSERATTKTVG